MSHLSSAGFEAVELSQVEEEHTELLFWPRGLITRISWQLFLNNIDQLSVPKRPLLSLWCRLPVLACSQPAGQLRLIAGHLPI